MLASKKLTYWGNPSWNIKYSQPNKVLERMMILIFIDYKITVFALKRIEQPSNILEMRRKVPFINVKIIPTISFHF